MIRESLYFSFAGRRSTDFGILNVNISEGLYEEQVASNKSINEIRVRGNDKPYFIDVVKEPKQFQLKFHFEETWNDDLINEVIRWLNVDFYEPLFFSEDIDRVYYVMPIDGINLIHNGLKQGYLTLNMRCDSPYGYGHEQVTPWYEVDNEKMIEIDNLGHSPIKPDIWIHKIGDGDISILNYSNGDKEFKFTGLKDKEELYIDCENELIDTNLPNTYRLDDFSDHYLSLVYGRNTLKVKGDCAVKFRYRYIYS